MSEDIHAKISRIFESTKYLVIKSEHDPNKYYILNKDDVSKQCVSFTINDDHIYVNLLTKCNNESSALQLKLIEQFANEMESINYIKLEDASHIIICGQSIDLAIFKILLSGVSWYNSLGYVSENYELEKIKNRDLKNMPVLKIITLSRNKEIEEFNANNTLEKLQEKLKNVEEKLKSAATKIHLNQKKKFEDKISNHDFYIKTEIDSIESYYRNFEILLILLHKTTSVKFEMTLHEVFLAIFSLLPKDCKDVDDTILKAFAKIIEIAEKLFLYKRKLTKLTRTRGGKKYKSKKSKLKKYKIMNKTRVYRKHAVFF
jgi:hypothetical protein